MENLKKVITYLVILAAITSMVLSIVTLVYAFVDQPYETEDDKLEAYATELHYATMHYAYESGLSDPNKIVKDLELYTELDPYIVLYTEDIDEEKLSHRSRKFYKETIDKIHTLEYSVDKAKDGNEFQTLTYLLDALGDDNALMMIAVEFDPDIYGTEKYPKPMTIDELKNGK